jgi:hypothetical protein
MTYDMFEGLEEAAHKLVQELTYDEKLEIREWFKTTMVPAMESFRSALGSTVDETGRLLCMPDKDDTNE